MTLRLGATRGMSLPWQVCFATLSQVTTPLKGYVTLWVEEPLLVSHHHEMFGGQCSSTSGDITDSIYHVTSQDHVIERSSNFVSESSSLYVATLRD